ncbi:transcription factor mef2A-like [Copidosoma floridanum]|uniref:transcription factor mef2A-like n=1 Tax=Copidosoma floridanum TaxID=29053 RepID=UPI000C6F85D5|nr:transcription factor mef2A-like [Copidosoma floridanum]
MSPASQGALEVERYIGSCLITSSGRSGLQKSFPGCHKQEIALRTPKQQQQQFRPYDQQCGGGGGNGGGPFGEVGAWAGGIPLINMSNPRRVNNSINNNNQQQQSLMCNSNQQAVSEQQQHHLQNRVPLSRLAVHTQGAPLILSGRFHNNRNNKMHTDRQSSNGLINNNNNSNSSAPKCHPQSKAGVGNKPTMLEQRRPHQQQQQSFLTGKPADGASRDVSTAGTTTANIDSLSIASDESSGSNNSENSLPRIIKPRKRRKKDRKPPLVAGVVTTSVPDIKTGDELTAAAQTSTSVISEHQPQQQQSQIKPYQANGNNNTYDGSRYSGDNYYNNNNNNNNNRGSRRSMNSNMRDTGYARPLHNSVSSLSSSNSIVPKSQPEVIDTRQQPLQQQQSQQMSGGGGVYPAHRHVQVKVLDDNRNVIPVCQSGKTNYQLRQPQQQQRFLHEHCTGESVTLTCQQESAPSDMCLPGEECSLQGALCQCRYCDPATLIWDVSGQYEIAPSSHRHHHRHHHHHHHHRFSQLPATVFLARPVICQEHPNAIDLIDVTDNPCLRLRPDGSAILRRSWSDPTSYFSDDVAVVPSRDVGVIGDRGGVAHDSLKGRSSWRGDASTAPANSSGSSGCSPNSSPGLQGPLEVSTEIVTSPNGHRDLEIKFYSSSPTTSYYTPYSGSGAEEVGYKGAFSFGTDDDASNDSEEFSDIWSYHESKLQQDFRTLLQAEE